MFTRTQCSRSTLRFVLRRMPTTSSIVPTTACRTAFLEMLHWAPSTTSAPTQPPGVWSATALVSETWHLVPSSSSNTSTQAKQNHGLPIFGARGSVNNHHLGACLFHSKSPPLQRMNRELSRGGTISLGGFSDK